LDWNIIWPIEREMSFANEMKKKGTRHKNQEEISGSRKAERVTMFKEKHEITEVIAFLGVHFFLRNAFVVNNFYCLAIKATSEFL
jgi:hypothetical protein